MGAGVDKHIEFGMSCRSRWFPRDLVVFGCQEAFASFYMWKVRTKEGPGNVEGGWVCAAF